jgi:hypothetical protein
MWETFSYGMMPYYGISNMEVIEKITREEGGHRLPCPKNCPKEIHQWMLDCWNQDPDSRPSFKELKLNFSIIAFILKKSLVTFSCFLFNLSYFNKSSFLKDISIGGNFVS